MSTKRLVGRALRMTSLAAPVAVLVAGACSSGMHTVPPTWPGPAPLTEVAQIQAMEAATKCTLTFANAQHRHAILALSASGANAANIASSGERSATIAVVPASLAFTSHRPTAAFTLETDSTATFVRSSGGACRRLWITALPEAQFRPGTHTFHVGWSDYAGDCLILVETPPVPSAPQWYGATNVQYDLGDPPRGLPEHRIVAGGVTFTPYVSLLTRAKPFQSIMMKTKFHGSLPAVPPVTVRGIRPYGSQCDQDWASNVTTSQYGLVVAPTSFQGPRQTFKAYLRNL